MECEIGNCGSRLFQVGDDGFTYCSEGHRQFQAGLVTADENEGLQPTGRRTIRKSQEEAEEVALTGKAGFEHYLVCFQLILWKQVKSFVAACNWSSELENIVRDLWSIRMHSLSDRLEQGDDAQDSQFFSSQDSADETGAHVTGGRHGTGAPNFLGVIDGVSLIYLGCIMLRQPVLAIDLLRMVNDGDIPYYRAVKDLDKGMVTRLQGHFHALLDPTLHLTMDRLQSQMSRTVTYFEIACGLHVPSINHHLVLWRLTKELCLPLETYTGTLRLSELLGLVFNYDTKRAKWERQGMDHPEQRLAGVLLVTCKLLFPFDGKERPPRRPTEPAALSMNWKSWRDKSMRTPVHKRSAFNEALCTSEDQVIDMPDDRLDQYMDWFNDMFATTEHLSKSNRARHKEDFKRTIQSMFPVEKAAYASPREAFSSGDGSQENSNRGAALVTGDMRPVRVLGQNSADEDVNRPGSQYIRYRSIEEMQTDEIATVVYKAFADSIGTSVGSLFKSVIAVEKILASHVES
ncbi:hypothetical protein CAC42_4803 [Sphaceloma murrayae]|uniref:Uncharacterized protein n=1 Tax=Sphaceloma murrayae TaxID=2082308 RepID=A0A2K1QPG5_9PEZI|nr:hypothetical protein CAC42_4803 [Sphaceloma murrayae]